MKRPIPTPHPLGNNDNLFPRSLPCWNILSDYRTQLVVSELDCISWYWLLALLHFLLLCSCKKIQFTTAGLLWSDANLLYRVEGLLASHCTLKPGTYVAFGYYDLSAQETGLIYIVIFHCSSSLQLIFYTRPSSEYPIQKENFAMSRIGFEIAKLWYYDECNYIFYLMLYCSILHRN